MTTQEQQDIIIKLAQENIGKPYKYGVKVEDAPNFFDCSSFVQYLYKNVGIDLPRRSLEQAHEGKEVSKDKQLEVGDLIFIKGSWGHYDPEFINGIGHVAIYIGGGKVINARYDDNGGSVKEEKSEGFINREDFRVIKRILGG